MSRIVTTKITTTTSSSVPRNISKKEESSVKSAKDIEKSKDIKKESENELKKDIKKDVILEKDKKKDIKKESEKKTIIEKDLKNATKKDLDNKKDTWKELDNKKDTRKDSLVATKLAKLETKKEVNMKTDIKKESEKPAKKEEIIVKTAPVKTTNNEDYDDNDDEEEYDDEDYDSEEDWEDGPLMDLGISVNAIKSKYLENVSKHALEKLKTNIDIVTSISVEFIPLDCSQNSDGDELSPIRSPVNKSNNMHDITSQFNNEGYTDTSGEEDEERQFVETGISVASLRTSFIAQDDDESDYEDKHIETGVNIANLRNNWSKAAQETDSKKLKAEVSGMGKDQLSSIASRFEKGGDSFKGQSAKMSPSEELEQLRRAASSEDGVDKRSSYILENNPEELPDDVIRGEKQDHGLENLPSLKNVKSRFENANQDLDDKPKERVNLNRAESIRKKMARFQHGGEDEEFGELENGHESDDDITRDPDVIRESRSKEELSFKGLTSIKQKFEAGDVDSKENEDEEKKRLELDELRKTSSVGSAKSRFEGVNDECPVVPRSPSKSPRTTPSREFPPNHEIVRESQERETFNFSGARSIKERFEKGSVLTEEGEEKAARLLAEKEKELGIFRSAKSKDYIEKFKQIESGALPASKPPKSPNSQRRSGREGSPESEDDENVLPAPGTARSLSMKFRQLSQPNDQPSERKPPRKITPPPDSINPNIELTNEPIERDPNVIRGDETTDELLPPSNYTKNLVAKFASIKDNPHANPERRHPGKISLPTDMDAPEGGIYESQPIRDPTVLREGDYEEDLPQLTDHTKALKAKFENIKTQNERPRRGRAKFKGKKYSEINEPLGCTAEKCYVCDKIVYAMERMEADRSVIHKSCFKCSHCGANLRLENYTSSEGILYCVPHFKQLFKAKGNYDEGFGREQHKDKWNRSRSTTPSREHNGDSSPEKENGQQSPMQVDNVVTAEA